MIHTMIATVDARTMMYPLKKVVKLVALAWICHGHVTHPPKTAVKKAPRLMLNHFGARNAKSFELAIELGEILVPSVGGPNAKAQKNAPAREGRKATMDVGSRYSLP